MIEKIQVLFKNIFSKIKGIDNDIFSLLNDATAIIATIIALLTIIFTFYNEKVIQEVEKAFLELNSDMSQLNQNRISIIKKYVNIQNSFSKNSLYLESMNVFRITLLIMTFPWFLSGLHHSISKNYLDALISIVSTSCLIFLLIYVPRLFEKFNNFNHFDNNLFDFNKFLQFNKDNYKQQENQIIKELYTPLIKIKLQKKSIFIEIKSEIKLYNIDLVLSLKKNTVSHMIVIKQNKSNLLPNCIKSMENPSNSLYGLFDEISKTKSKNNKIYLINEVSTYCFNLVMDTTKEDEIIFSLKDIITDSIPLPVKTLHKSTVHSLINSKISGTAYEYKLEETK